MRAASVASNHYPSGYAGHSTLPLPTRTYSSIGNAFREREARLGRDVSVPALRTETSWLSNGPTGFRHEVLSTPRDPGSCVRIEKTHAHRRVLLYGPGKCQRTCMPASRYDAGQ